MRLLQALKCDYSALAGVLGEHIAFLGANPDADVLADAPDLAATLRLVAANVSLLTTAGCRDVALAAAHPDFPLSRRALQQLPPTVLATAPFAAVTLILSILAGDPVIGQVPTGELVATVVAARLAAARAGGAASFPLTLTYWSAASAVGSWGNTTFLTPGNTTETGDTQGTLQPSAPAVNTLAIVLGVIFGLAFVIFVVTYSACCGWCTAAGCSRRCRRGDEAPPKPLDAEIAQDRSYAGLAVATSSAADDMDRGYFAEERAHADARSAAAASAAARVTTSSAPAAT